MPCAQASDFRPVIDTPKGARQDALSASTRFPPRDWRARGIKTCVQHAAADKSRIAANPHTAANPRTAANPCSAANPCTTANPHVVGKSRIVVIPLTTANPHVVGIPRIVARCVLLRDAYRWQVEHRRLHPASLCAECRAYARVRGAQKRGHGQQPRSALRRMLRIVLFCRSAVTNGKNSIVPPCLG